jgi:hypothetical protein
MGAARWEELAVLAARERDLAASGRWEELAAATDARTLLAGTLGDPPPAARPHLERALAIQAELVALIEHARATTLGELGRLRRGRGAVQAYATPAASAGWVDHSR